VRLIFLHSSKEWSGTARAFARAGRGLAERGWKITMIAPADSNVELGLSAQGRVWGKSSEPVYDVLPHSTEGFWYFAARRLRKLFRRWDADAVFVTTDREHLIAATTCWLARRGVVVRRTPAGQKLEMTLSGRFASWLRPTAFLFASDADQNAAVLPKGALGNAIAEVGIDSAEYPEPPADESNGGGPARHIVCVYDPSSRGRAATAIRCVSMLAPRHPELRLLIVGAGSDHEDLRMQAAALRILHLVSFLGERDDQVAIMKDADLGWVVAEGDSGAYGLLDLMALAKPVVAGDDGVSPQYVADGINGLLYPPNDSATTAALVAGLLGSEENRRAMGRAGRIRATRDFSEKEMIDGFARAAEIAQKRSKR
jgi:glycosyltransferase involved in cell wall biosynthesis